MCCCSQSLFCQKKENLNKDIIAYIETYKELEINEEKIVYLKESTNYLKERNYDSLLKQIVTYKKLKNTHLPITHLITAEIYVKTRDYKLAAQYFQESLNSIITRRSDDYVLFTHLYLNLLHLEYYKSNTYFERIKIAEKALFYAKKTNNLILTNKVLSHLIRNYISVNEVDKVLEYTRKSRDIGIALKDSTIIYTRNADIIIYLAKSGFEKEALNIWYTMTPKIHSFKFKKSHYDESNSSIFYGDILIKAAEVYYLNKKNDSALTLLEKAEKHNPLKTFMPLNLIKAKLYYNNQNIDTAIFYLERELQLKKGITLDRIVEASELLAKCYLAKKNFKNAKSLIKRIDNDTSHVTVKLTSILRLRSKFYSTISKVYEQNKQLDSALYYNRVATNTLNDYNKLNNNNQLALAKIELENDDFIKKNQELITSNELLNSKVSSTKEINRYLIISFLLLSLLLSLFLYNKRQKEKLKLSQYKEQLTYNERIAIEAELNSIRSQMNPHFMFNALNSINEFIQNDSSEDASNYLVKFSRLMRFTLNHSKQKFVNLKEEIDLINLYVELENLRFYKSIDYNLIINTSLNLDNIFIPPMMIQPFVENAIWHGLMAKEKDRKLTLSFSENKQSVTCKIQDNGIGRAASVKQKTLKSNYKSQGIGLTQRRLELLENIYDKEAQIEIEDIIIEGEAAGTLVKVILPKLNVNERT